MFFVYVLVHHVVCFKIRKSTFRIVEVIIAVSVKLQCIVLLE